MYAVIRVGWWTPGQKLITRHLPTSESLVHYLDGYLLTDFTEAERSRLNEWTKASQVADMFVSDYFVVVRRHGN